MTASSPQPLIPPDPQEPPNRFEVYERVVVAVIALIVLVTLFSLPFPYQMTEWQQGLQLTIVVATPTCCVLFLIFHVLAARHRNRFIQRPRGFDVLPPTHPPQGDRP